MKQGNNYRINIVRFVLDTIAVFGEAIPRMIALDARKNFRLFRERGLGRSVSPAYINETIKRLRSRGFIQYKTIGRESRVVLTDKGRLKLGQFKLEGIDPEKKKKWDGKWRVIIFDISESKRGLRDILRGNLVRIGFQRLQNSVWLYPYNCEEMVNLLKTDFRLGGDVLYMTVDYIENGDNLKKLFEL